MLSIAIETPTQISSANNDVVYRIEFLRSVREFFQVMFKLEPHKREDAEELKLGDDKILLTCVGVGYSNLNKVLL